LARGWDTFRDLILDARGGGTQCARETMKTFIKLCAAMLALHTSGHVFAGGEGWLTDIDAAKKTAAESKKDLLIDFTGSDWCGWCIKLNDEVFKHDAFKAGVKDSFVLVEIDFPREKGKLSEDARKRNTELGEKYAVQGYPTILLCDAEGKPFAATGYEKGGPEKYVDHLNELRKNKSKRDEAFAKAAKASGVEKAKVLIAALDAMELDENVVANFYGDITEQIRAADPKDETGFAKKAETGKRLEAFQKSLQEFGAKRDHEGALALVDKTLKEGGFDAEVTTQIMMTRAAIFASTGKFDEALKAVDEAKAFAPNSKMVPMIEQFRKRIAQGKEEATKKAPAAGEEKKAD
jgi:thioredoxin-related protein